MESTEGAKPCYYCPWLYLCNLAQEPNQQMSVQEEQKIMISSLIKTERFLFQLHSEQATGPSQQLKAMKALNLAITVPGCNSHIKQMSVQDQNTSIGHSGIKWM